MYNDAYSEYMNNLIGCNVQMYRNSMYNNPIELYQNIFTYQQTDKTLEECYPDIYKIIYPMVCKACLYINEEITEELVERITNEIYENLEQDEEPEENRSAELNSNNIQNSRMIKYDHNNIKHQISSQETRQKNFILKDLIKILVLRELIGNDRRPHMQKERFLNTRTEMHKPIE